MTSAYEIVTSLPKGIWAASHNRGKACCPAHEDNEPSLGVKQEGDKVLVHCFAGCSQEDVIRALQLRSLWPETPTSLPAQAKSKPKPVPAVIADDETDNERILIPYKIYYAARGPKYFPGGRTTENPKTNVKGYLTNRGITANVLDDIYELPAGKLKQFGLRRAGSAMVAPMVASSALCGSSDDWFTGVHITGLARDARSKAGNDARRMRGVSKGSVVPFGPPEGDTLLIAEGLETAMSVFQATGKSTWSALSAGNMNAIAIPSWTKEVIVCADNDNAGLKAAKPLAERVAAMGKTARLAIPENDGDDWNDTLQSHGDEFCRDAILKAEIIEALTPQSFRVITAGQFLDLTFPPRENLLPPWLPRQGLALIHGWRGVGKTWVVLGIACAVASGKEFLGWTAGRPAEVLYVDGELPASVLQDRLRQFQATFGDEIGDRIWIDTPDRRDGIVPDLSTLEGQAEIDKWVRPETALIIIDSISTLCRSGDENDASSWMRVQEWAIRHRAQGRAVLFVHHQGKGRTQRGTSHRETVMDTVINLDQPEEHSAEDGAAFIIKFEKNRAFFGVDAAPRKASIRVDDDKVVWTVDDVDGVDPRLQKIVDMLKSGSKQIEIANQLNLSRSRVSQLVKKATELGLIEADDSKSD